MMMRFITIFLLLAFLCANAFAQSIEKISLGTTKHVSKKLIDSLEKYLERYRGLNADETTALSASEFIAGLKFVSYVDCQLKGHKKSHLHCYVKAKYSIRDIVINNLPLGLLENELKRKLPVQIGQLVTSSSESNSEMLKITKSRVETFLRKNGYYWAKVTTSLQKIPNDLAVLIKIGIDGGVFARVNEVYLEGNSPVSSRSVRKTFQRMCLAFNRLFQVFSYGTLSCYSRELERAALNKLQDRLAKLGYIQAQVSLSHRWLDPSAPLTPKHCRNSKLHSDEPFCVDLHVRIEKGPKVRSVITIREGDMVSRSAFARFFGSFFAVEQLSRAVRALDEPLPFDQVIIKEELEKRISFVESKNITEDEVAESAQLMKEYLVSKGYTNAEVVASYHVQNPKNIIVYFDIYPGSSYYVKSFRIMPEKFVKYIEKNELSDLMETRGFLKPGRLSYNKINKALEDVKRKLSEKGFRNVQAKIEMVSLDDGGVEVVFNIATGKREFISEIKVINGEEELDKEILPFLRNCNSAKKKINPNNLCQGSALDRDGILSDEKKIANFYINNDFLYAKVFSSLSESEQGYELKFYIYDSRWGKKSKLKMHRQDIKNIIISGNNSISTEVIKRLFPKAKNNNARYDSISLKKGMSLLRESNRFSNIDAKIKVGQENSEDAYFAVHVTQKPSLTLDAALSFSTDQLLSLELELEENNLFYSMLKLNTNLGLGLFWGRQTFLSNKFIWPFMFGSPFRFSLQAPVIVYDDKTSRPKPSRRLQNKVITSLEWRATPFLMPYTRYSLTHIMKQEFPNNLVPRLSAQERFLSIDGLTHVLKAPGKIRGMLKTGLSFIKLDNATDPHSGIDVNSFFEISGGPFIGDPFFTNLGIQNKFYVPLKSTTLAFQFSLMRAFVRPNTKNWDELTEVSAMDNLGGDRRVRGYKEAAISPVHSWLPSDNFGGYFLNTANIEWRFPLTNPEILGSFSGALFVDQGMVLSCRGLSCSQDYSFSQLITKMGFGLSVGAGLRYNLPVGPISLDYAYSPLHNESRVHVQFGYAF